MGARARAARLRRRPHLGPGPALGVPPRRGRRGRGGRLGPDVRRGGRPDQRPPGDLGRGDGAGADGSSLRRRDEPVRRVHGPRPGPPGRARERERLGECPMSEKSRLRLFVLQVLVLSLLMTLMGRLWYVQVVADENYVRAAAENRTREIVTPA